MAIITCPSCSHSALYIDTEVLESKMPSDEIKSKDFKVILSWEDKSFRFKQAQDGEYIMCHNCGEGLVWELRKEWRKARELALVGEWDK